MNKEILEIQKEDNDKTINLLESARAKLKEKGILTEMDFPIELRNEWKNNTNAFIEENLVLAYSLNEEYEQSFSYWNFKKPVMPLSEEEEIKLSSIIDSEIDDIKFKRKGIDLDEMERNKDIIILNKEDGDLY